MCVCVCVCVFARVCCAQGACAAHGLHVRAWLPAVLLLLRLPVVLTPPARTQTCTPNHPPPHTHTHTPRRYERDVDPPLSEAQQYIVRDMSGLAYCHLLAVGSVDGLVEASRQSRVCAGAANPVACTIFRCARCCAAVCCVAVCTVHTTRVA
jgi:hypothetical protein